MVVIPMFFFEPILNRIKVKLLVCACVCFYRTN